MTGSDSADDSADNLKLVFVPLHHVQKGTRLSPSLLFIVVVGGRAWERGYLKLVSSHIQHMQTKQYLRCKCTHKDWHN